MVHVFRDPQLPIANNAKLCLKPQGLLTITWNKIYVTHFSYPIPFFMTLPSSKHSRFQVVQGLASP